MRPPNSTMDDKKLLRYNRHILLPQIDIHGQESICSARVLIIGLGGLGSPVSMYLAASGVGELILVDDDIVDESNLQRQIVHTEETLGLSKVESAKKQLNRLNSFCKVFIYKKRLTENELRGQIENADVVVDCSDNFATRNLINKVCHEMKAPLVSGAAVRMEGQLSVFDFRDEQCPCYNCLYETTGTEDLSCAQNGVLAPVVGIVGTAQALETLKIITGVGTILKGKLALFDGASNMWRYLNFKKDSNCKVCGV